MSKKTQRSEQRIAFGEEWVVRFMGVLDSTLDDATKKMVMEENGRRCYHNWTKESGRKIKPVTLEQYKKWVGKHESDGSIRFEGNVIHFQYMSAAETGLPSKEGECLCPLVESKPKGLSAIYCHCSVGYVKEWHERLLRRPVDVELVESVLNGGKRCRFKITLA